MTIAITAGWEHLEEGSPEERACFAAIGIRVDDLWLTEAQDTFVNRVRQQVHLSAYRLAEWIAWNWWRLRWEPRSSKRIDWASAHHLPSVGGGYVWPNLTVFSDGERVALISSATASKKHEPIRYLSDSVMAVQASVFFNAVDGFIEQVLGQLSAEGVAETNLGAIWSDVQAERQDIEMSRWRQVEALLGYDPDEASPHEVEHVIQGDLEVGGHGFTELAAARKDGQSVKDLSHLKKNGRDSRRRRQAVRRRETVASEHVWAFGG